MSRGGHFCGSALTVETVFEIMKCVCVMSICVAACAWGQNRKFSCFSIVDTPTIEIFRFSIFRRRASTVTGNTLIEPNYA